MRSCDRKIAPTLTAGGAAELHPSVVFIGAQPGAGKSRAIADVHSERPGAVPVIGDDLRAFHPDYRALMRTDPLAMPHVTAQASGAWVGMAADYLRAERLALPKTIVSDLFYSAVRRARCSREPYPPLSQSS